jgi:hypothetical protein
MIDVGVVPRVELGCREYGGTATGLPTVPIDPSGLARGPCHEDGSRVVEVAPGPPGSSSAAGRVGLTVGMGTRLEGVPARGRGRLTGSSHGLTNRNERNRRSIRGTRSRAEGDGCSAANEARQPEGRSGRERAGGNPLRASVSSDRRAHGQSLDSFKTHRAPCAADRSSSTPAPALPLSVDARAAVEGSHLGAISRTGIWRRAVSAVGSNPCDRASSSCRRR